MALNQGTPSLVPNSRQGNIYSKLALWTTVPFWSPFKKCRNSKSRQITLAPLDLRQCTSRQTAATIGNGSHPCLPSCPGAPISRFPAYTYPGASATYPYYYAPYQPAASGYPMPQPSPPAATTPSPYPSSPFWPASLIQQLGKHQLTLPPSPLLTVRPRTGTFTSVCLFTPFHSRFPSGTCRPPNGHPMMDTYN